MSDPQYRDWASIPPDILLLILKNLLDLADFVKFHAICRPWRTAVLQYPHPSPFLPLLVDRCSPKCCFYFHSPFSSKSIAVHFPELSDSSISGPAHGKMLFKGKPSQFALFNPFTMDVTYLPPLETNFSQMYLIEHREMIVLSAISEKTLYFMSSKMGDNKWSVIKHPVKIEGAGNIFFKGLYYFNESLEGPTIVVNPSNGKTISIIPAPIDRNFHLQNWKNTKAVDYLIESKGSLLRIYRFYDIFDSVESCYFEIHRLNYTENSLSWVKLVDIGDQMLFLDRLHGISKSSDGITGMRGNCIYFTKYMHFDNVGWSGILCKYDIGNGETQVSTCLLEGRGSWVVPSLV